MKKLLLSFALLLSILQPTRAINLKTLEYGYHAILWSFIAYAMYKGYTNPKEVGKSHEQHKPEIHPEPLTFDFSKVRSRDTDYILPRLPLFYLFGKPVYSKKDPKTPAKTLHRSR